MRANIFHLNKEENYFQLKHTENNYGNFYKITTIGNYRTTWHDNKKNFCLLFYNILFFLFYIFILFLFTFVHLTNSNSHVKITSLPLITFRFSLVYFVFLNKREYSFLLSFFLIYNKFHCVINTNICMPTQLPLK